MKRVISLLITAGLSAGISSSVTACKREGPPSGPAAPASASSERVTASPKVARIVFVGKRDACHCTRERVDEALAALEAALQGRADVIVEPLEIDVDEVAVAGVQRLRPIMVLPAIYLLEDSGSLIDVLQGEVTVEQLRAAVGG